MKKVSVKKLQAILDDLTNMYAKLIEKNSFNEALNVMKNIEITIKQLQYIRADIIEADLEKSSDWYDVLKFFVDRKISHRIKLDYSNRKEETKHRDTGKTTALLKLASEYKIPILVNKYQHNELDSKAKSLELDVCVVDPFMLGLAQYENQVILLVDEGFKYDATSMRGTALHNKILIGFE